MKYLSRFADRGENGEISPTPYHKELTEPTKPGFVSSVSPPPMGIGGIRAHNVAARPIDPGPWDAAKAGERLSRTLSRIAELVPVGCPMDSDALRAAIGAVDVSFEAGDGPSFAARLAELEATARREVAVWRKSRGEHAGAIKIFSEVLGAHLWVVLDPDDTAPDPAQFDAPVYSRAEVERLVEAHKRGELHPDQLRALHKVKRTWPDVRVQPVEEEAEALAEAKEPTRAVRIKHARTGQEVIVVDTVLDSWLRGGWNEVKPETTREVDPGSTNSSRPNPGHGLKKEER